ADRKAVSMGILDSAASLWVESQRQGRIVGDCDLPKRHDDGRDYRAGDPRALLAEVGHWNELIAAALGALKDACGSSSASFGANWPSSKYPEGRHSESGCRCRSSRKRKVFGNKGL
ncbi:MAG: hypothetical protein B7Z73_12780, partial [Planctomycetia bacterium 21-64-5]